MMMAYIKRRNIAAFTSFANVLFFFCFFDATVCMMINLFLGLVGGEKKKHFV
jgi:hypothetical protein